MPADLSGWYNLDDICIMREMLTMDDLKVGLASLTGIGNWLVDIELILQITISLASLVYIVLKIKEQLDKIRRNKK